jgi:serine/threonine-protein kinase
VVKLLKASARELDVLARFRREVEIMRRLDHPNIVPIIDEGEVDGTVFFTMPYVPGPTLRERIGNGGPLPVDEALRIARDLAEALGHAHGQGIVHRDVKPENLVLGPDGAVLLDFGFAHSATLTSENAAAQEAQMVIGTPGYISPEQLSGRRAEDWRSDFFSFACVLFEMLTGRAPYGAGGSQATVQQRMAQGAPDVRSVRPDVPDDVAALIRKNLALTPNDRHGMAMLLVMAIDSALRRVYASMADGGGDERLRERQVG